MNKGDRDVRCFSQYTVTARFGPSWAFFKPLVLRKNSDMLVCSDEKYES